MNFVLDSNVLFAALIKDSEARKIILYPGFNFFVPGHVLDEFLKYEDLIKKKSKLNEKNFNQIFGLILNKLNIIPEEFFLEKIDYKIYINAILTGIYIGA